MSYLQCLVAVDKKADLLTLRIASVNLSPQNQEEPLVLELNLVGCQNSDTLFHHLSSEIGKPFEYEINEDIPSGRVSVWVPTADRIITCTSVRNTSKESTIADWRCITHILAVWYISSDNAHQVLSQHYASLKAQLERELDRNQKKARLLQEIRPEKVETVLSHIKIYEQIITLLNSTEEASKQ